MAEKLEVNPDELEVADELIAERRHIGDLPPDMPQWMRSTITRIDTLSLWSGRLFCLMLVPMAASMVIEIVARKFFNAPTIWAFDVSRMLSGAMFMLGAAYALMRGVHIRADFLYRNWAPKTQATVDGILYSLLFFPSMILFFWLAYDWAISAWFRWERVSDTALMAPVGPMRMAVPVGAILLLIQGIAETLRCAHTVGGLLQRILYVVCAIVAAFVVAYTIMMLGYLGPNYTPSWLAGLIEGVKTGVDVVLGAVTSGLDAIKDALGMEKHVVGVFMIATMLFAIFIGFPISFTLLFLGIVFGSIGYGSKLTFFHMSLEFNRSMLEDQLIAVPLFVLMGILMEQAGLMERLFRAIQLMLSTAKGALYIAVLFVSTIFAAATGIVGASVTILGIMAAKTMNESGYNVRLSAGSITAGGTLGILIPPSIMLVVMGPVLEVPVTQLFSAAIIPGILLAVLYTLYALVRCWLDPSLGPPLPEDQRPTDYGFVMREFFLGLIPPTILIGFALGSILLGWATPKEAAGFGAFGGLLLTLAYRKMTFATFFDALVKTLEISVLILFLVAASNFFGAVFSNLGTPKVLTDMLLAWDLDKMTVLIIIMALIFLLGWPLEWVPIVLIIVPILVPTLEQLDVNLTWFAILVAVNLQTAWLSPPVALSAYFLKGVVPEWDLKDIYLGMMQFMVIQLIGLILIFMFPQIALWLPGVE